MPAQPDDRDVNAGTTSLATSPGGSSSMLSGTAVAPGPVLEIEDLHTEFHLRTVNVRAVDGVSFSVRSGECLGLVGESGCGKTTIGLSVMKLLPNVGHLTGGAVRLNGRDLAPLGEPEMRKVRGNDIGDDLPGPDDLPEPDLDDRAADRRASTHP